MPMSLSIGGPWLIAVISVNTPGIFELAISRSSIMSLTDLFRSEKGVSSV